jgi:hypothetical protein
MNHCELYSDGIARITVTGGVVRVDLESLSPTECDANNNPKSTFRQRLIFSLDGFVKSVEVMQKAFQGLVDGGVIQRKPCNVARTPPPVAEQPRPRKGVYHSKH